MYGWKFDLFTALTRTPRIHLLWTGQSVTSLMTWVQRFLLSSSACLFRFDGWQAPLSVPGASAMVLIRQLLPREFSPCFHPNRAILKHQTKPNNQSKQSFIAITFQGKQPFIVITSQGNNKQVCVRPFPTTEWTWLLQQWGDVVLADVYEASPATQLAYAAQQQHTIPRNGTAHSNSAVSRDKR